MRPYPYIGYLSVSVEQGEIVLTKKQEKKKPRRNMGFEKPKGLLDLVDRISTPFTAKDYEILTTEEESQSQKSRKAKAKNGFKLKKFILSKD